MKRIMKSIHQKNHSSDTGYKQTEVGVIPEDWDLDYIENLAHITTGGRNTQDRVNDGQYPFFVRSQTVERINSYSFDGEAVLTAGDGVGTGKVFHYIKGKFDAHQRVYRISDFNERINGYFFYLYFSSHFYNRIMQMTAKSSVDSVRRDMIARMLIPFPSSKAEQEAIAEALSDADALIESLEHLIAKKRHLKQGAMQELLTGKKRLPGFIEKWETHTFGEMFDILRSASNPRSDLVEHGEIGYLHYGDIHTHPSPFLDCSCQLRAFLAPGQSVGTPMMVDGDLVMVDASEDTIAIGKAVEIKSLNDRRAVAGLHTLLLRPKPEFFANGFKGYLQYFPSVRSSLVRSATGVSVYGVSKSSVKTIEVTIPKPDEQTAIAAILSDMDAEIAALEDKLAKARQIKQGMMQELLTGRIRLTGGARGQGESGQTA